MVVLHEINNDHSVLTRIRCGGAKHIHLLDFDLGKMAHRYNVFSLPSQLVDTLTPRTLIGQAQPREPSPPPPKVAPISNAKGCNICLGVAFADVDEQRAHFRTDWHRYNVKIRLSGGNPVTESAFAQLVGGTHLLLPPRHPAPLTTDAALPMQQAWMILFRVPLPPTMKLRTNQMLSMHSLAKSTTLLCPTSPRTALSEHRLQPLPGFTPHHQHRSESIECYFPSILHHPHICRN